MAKSPAEIGSLAREACPKAINTVRGIMNSPETAPQVKLQAAVILMDRGLGKPQQAVSLEVAVTVTKIERVIIRPGDLIETVVPELIDITPEPDNAATVDESDT